MDTETLADEPAHPTAHPIDCLNCGTSLAPGDRFCRQCAQKADTRPLTWRHFSHELFHALAPADASVLHLFKDLIVRPGVVAREYLQGRRKKYFSPFSWFLISAGSIVVINGLLGKVPADLEANPAVLARLPTEAARASYLAVIQRSGQVTHFMATHGNLFAMAAVPLLAFIFWLFYRRRHNYVEFLLATLLFESVTNLLVPPAFALLTWTNGGDAYPHMALGGQVIQIGYLAFALSGLLRLTSLPERLGAICVAAIAVAAWTATIFSALGWYVLQNRQFYRVALQMMRGL
jgi:hypothetical protein